jgi:hypothetical protein
MRHDRHTVELVFKNCGFLKVAKLLLQLDLTKFHFDKSGFTSRQYALHANKKETQTSHSALLIKS